MRNERVAHGYGIFARFYDALTENVDYLQIADYYLKMLDDYGVSDGSLLDLACGTGSLTEKLAEKSSFLLTAVDLSLDMLSITSSKIGFDKIRILQSDMIRLRFKAEFDAVICALDSLNHLSSLTEMEKTFIGVKNSLKVGGLFAFDMNSVKKHRQILGNNTFVYDVEGVFCTWQNEYFAENERVEITLDFFASNSGDGDNKNTYKRYHESFSETAYPIHQIREMLVSCGFEVVSINDYLTRNNADENVEKFSVLARKV